MANLLYDIKNKALATALGIAGKDFRKGVE
jgi:hypothetical protein